MDTIKQLLEVITSVLGLIGIILFGYALLMGTAHKTGRSIGFQLAKTRRIAQGKPNIHLLSNTAGSVFPWQDPSLIKAGFSALILVGILSSFVFFMLLSMANDNALAVEELVGVITILMGYPVFMGAFSVIMMASFSIFLEKLLVLPVLLLDVVNIVCAIATFHVIKLPSSQINLLYQFGLFLVVSLSLSSTYGMLDGIKDANIENRFPLVNLVTTKGNTVERLRLYEKTDTDYRLIGEDGIDHIIPSVYIVEIQHVPEEVKEKAFGASANTDHKTLHLLQNFLLSNHRPPQRALDDGDAAVKLNASTPKKKSAKTAGAKPTHRK